MSLFTPLTGLLGGSLIGASSGVLLVLNGDIMGISGILNNSIVRPTKTIRDPKCYWRWVWLASFALTVNIYINYLGPDRASADRRSEDPDVSKPSMVAMLLGSILVGIGTRIGNGCTSGHGICGISRFSLRSIVATCTFTGAAILTRAILSPLRSWATYFDFLRTNQVATISPLASALFMAVTTLAVMVRPMPAIYETENTGKKSREVEADFQKGIGAALSGVIFAMGLTISGMTKNSKVHDFLCFSGLSRRSYDPTLIMVMVSGIFMSWLSYQFVPGYAIRDKQALSCPVNQPEGSCFAVPTNRVVDLRLITGATIFGMGWGFTGICPGPGLYAAASGNVTALLVWMPGFIVGSLVGENLIQSIWERPSTITTNKAPEKKVA